MHRVDDGIHAGCKRAANQIPVDGIHHRIDGIAERIHPSCDRAAHVIPVNEVLDALESIIDLFTDDLAQLSEITIGKSLFQTIHKVGHTGINGNFFKHLGWVNRPIILFRGFIGQHIQFIKAGKLPLCILCGFRGLVQRFGVVLLDGGCLFVDFLPRQCCRKHPDIRNGLYQLTNKVGKGRSCCL